jgi:Protein of unknown function (DUF2934)
MVELRRRAYKLYEEHGRADGHALEDWLQGEADLARPRAAVDAFWLKIFRCWAKAVMYTSNKCITCVEDGMVMAHASR